MNEKKNYKPFDKEAKVLLLNALKRGNFEQSDIDMLAQKGCIDKMKLEVEIIHSKEQIKPK